MREILRRALKQSKKFSYLKYELFDDDGGGGAGIAEKLMEIRVEAVCFSMVHRKKELITFFASGISADLEETDDGLERLIVVAVGLDAVIDAAADGDETLDDDCRTTRRNFHE